MLIEEVEAGYNIKKERGKAVQEIVRLRKMERASWKYYVTMRDLSEYQNVIGDLEPLFEYVKGLDGGNKILDIGAGCTLATAQMATRFGEYLNFEATILCRAPIKFSRIEGLDKSKIHITSVEVLRGIAESSCGGVIAVNSVAYSASSILAVKNIDRILVPGGVFKGCFLQSDFPKDMDRRGMKKRMPFEDIFNRLSYRCASTDYHDRSLLLAIKRGGRDQIEPNSLL